MAASTSSSSLFSDVVKEAVLQKTISHTSMKSVSSSSLGNTSGSGEDAPDWSVKRTLNSAKFKKAAFKSLRLKKQNKLVYDDAMKTRHSADLLLRDDSISTNQPEYEEQSNEDYLKHSIPKKSDDAVFQSPTGDELDKACEVALKAYYDLRVFRSDKDNEHSMQYISELFAGVPSFQTCNLEKEKEANKQRQLAIKCELLRGRGLPARDADGKSDPYCKMVILNKKYIGEKIVQKGDITSWVEAGLVNGEGVIQSSVRQGTLEPDWNGETLELNLKNPEEEYLVIEVWDSDDEDRKKKIKGIKGFGKFLQDLAGVDDFMGRAFFLLKHLPVDGEEKDIMLYSHSTKHDRGTVTMKMNILEKGKVFQSEDEKFEEYNQITKVVMAHESSKDGEYIRRWSGDLSEEGRSLLSQQVSLRGLTSLREVAIRFSLLMDYHKSYAVSMTALERSVEEMRSFESALSQVNEPSPPQWLSKVFSEMKELYTDIINILKIHLERFSFKSQADIMELKAYLLTLKSICSCDSFLTGLGGKKESFNDVVLNSIQGAVPTWFLILSANLMPSSSSIADKMVASKALCSHCLKQCDRVIREVQPVFMEVGVDYFSPFFFALDKLICTEVESVIGLDDSTLLLGYEIYQIIRSLKPFVKYVDQQFLKSYNSASLYVCNFHCWFKGCVPQWIYLAQCLAKDRLKNAVELDKVVSYTDQACFSSSAVDAHGMFIQVINFWKDLDWPDREQSVGYFATIIQNLSELATYYADLITSKVTPDYYTGKDGRVIITDKLCITLNNIQHVKMVINEIGDVLDLQRYYKFLDEGSSDHTLSKRAEELRVTILSSAEEDIQEKKNSIVRQVHKLIVPTVTGLVTDIMKSEDFTVPSETVFEPLLDYIAHNMGKLGEALLTPNFIHILELLWQDVIAMLHREYEGISHKTVNIPLFARLKDLAITLSDFFEADGNGLSRKQMETQPYMILLKEISVGATTTQGLIRIFLKDIVKQQKEAPEEFGVLRFSHIYDEKDKLLKVVVLSASGIPALDKSGKSDPFVVVHMLPVDLFPKAAESHYKTDIKKQTLEPFFNSKFDIPVESYKLKEDGAIILLAMFDWDKIGKNDFAGICVAATSTTPHSTELKMEHMKLFHYKRTLAFRELEKRSSENLANDFLKLMKKFVFDEDNIPMSPSTGGLGSHFRRLTTFGKAS